MIDSSRQHIRPHHHTRPATGRRIVHGTMLIGCKVPDLNGIAGPFAVHQGAPRKRLTERTGEHLRVESEDLSSKSHQLSRSEEHTSELQSLMRISYAVFCLKKKRNTQHSKHT